MCVRAQGFTNRFPFPTFLVVTSAERILNYSAYQRRSVRVNHFSPVNTSKNKESFLSESHDSVVLQNRSHGVDH
jgi:hypothetical protein